MSVLRGLYWFGMLLVLGIMALPQLRRDEVEEMEAAEAAERGQM